MTDRTALLQTHGGLSAMVGRHRAVQHLPSPPGIRLRPTSADWVTCVHVCMNVCLPNITWNQLNKKLRWGHEWVFLLCIHLSKFLLLFIYSSSSQTHCSLPGHASPKQPKNCIKLESLHCTSEVSKSLSVYTNLYTYL